MTAKTTKTGRSKKDSPRNASSHRRIKRASKKAPSRHVISRQLALIKFKTISLVITMFLAGITVVLDVRDPVVWAFLGTVVGITFGQPASGSKV